MYYNPDDLYYEDELLDLQDLMDRQAEETFRAIIAHIEFMDGLRDSLVDKSLGCRAPSNY